MSAFDIVGLLLSGIGGVIQAASLLKRLCDGNAEIDPLLEEARMKSQRIHLSIAMLTDFFEIDGIQSELFSDMLKDFGEVKEQFASIEQKLKEKPRAVIFFQSQGFVENIAAINAKLATHEHSLRIISMISSVVNRTSGKLHEKLDIILEALTVALSTEKSSVNENGLLSNLRYRLIGDTGNDSIEAPNREILAAAGSSLVHFVLGKAFYEGSPRKQNFHQALRNFNVAIQQGEWAAAYYLGLMYFDGQGVDACFSTAFKYFKLGADKGDAASMERVGFCSSFGHGTYVNVAEGTKYFKMAAEGGNASGCCNYGFARLYGCHVERNWSHAVKLLQKARQEGEFRAHTQLAVAYERGVGVKRNSIMAFQLWEEASLAGQIYATNHLARAYDEGIGCEKDVVKASALYRECTEWGTWESKLYEPFYAMRLILGKGVPKDEVGGLKMIRKSLTSRNAHSWCTYGDCFRFGYGVKKDIATATKCYIRATQAHQGRRSIIAAHVALGQLYETTNTTYSNIEKAVHHFRCAADQLECVAQLKMGLFYEAGTGVESHAYHAFYYFDLAARGGNTTALTKASEYYMKGIGVQLDRFSSGQMLEEAVRQGDSRAKLFLQRISIRRILDPRKSLRTKRRG